MSTNVVNQIPYLRTTRDFPKEIHQMSVEMNRAYVDIANAVNNRTISIFPTNRPAITGEAWFFTGTRQQTLRRIYTFSGAVVTIPHQIDTFSIDSFTRCWGYAKNNATGRFYGIIWSSDVAIPGQLSFYITPSTAPGVFDGNITFIAGAGAPSYDEGTIILEWLSKQ